MRSVAIDVVGRAALLPGIRGRGFNSSIFLVYQPGPGYHRVRSS